MLKWATKIRRGEGPFWGRLKWTAQKILHFHIPVRGVTKPIFSFLYGVHVLIREGGIWALRFFWFEPLFRSQCHSIGQRFQMEKLPYVNGRGRISIGDGVRLSGKSGFQFSNRVYDNPEVRIGNETFVGHACSFQVAESITIGNHCYLAGGVRVFDWDGHPLNAERRRAKDQSGPEDIRPVTIGDDVWIGTGALILKGVTIGDRSIVGAGAVVIRSVPCDAVVAGNPAVVVKELVPQLAFGVKEFQGQIQTLANS